MDPLEALLRPLAVLMNRQIRATTPARELSRDIDGSVIAIRVSNSALAMYFHVHEERIALTGSYQAEPDVVIAGSLLALAKLATPSATEAIRDGAVELHGDARIAQAFQRLLRHSKPDLEEELSAIVGDSAAHEIGEFGRQLLDWGQRAGTTMRQNVSEYLREESRAVPNRDEADAFRHDVNALRDDVERFEARLNRLQHTRPPRNRPPDGGN